MRYKKLALIGTSFMMTSTTVATVVSCSGDGFDENIMGVKQMSVTEFKKEYNHILDLDIDKIEFKYLEPAVKARDILIAMNNNAKNQLKDKLEKLERIWKIKNEYYALGWSKAYRTYQRLDQTWREAMGKTSFQNIRWIAGWAEEFNAADSATQRIIAERHPSYVDGVKGWNYEKARDKFETAKTAFENEPNPTSKKQLEQQMKTARDEFKKAEGELFGKNDDDPKRYYPKDIYNSLKKKGTDLIEWKRNNYRMIEPSKESKNMIIEGLIKSNDSSLGTKSEKIKAISEIFLGKDYGQNRLIGSNVAEEIIIADLENPDCFTYLDYVVALLMTRTTNSPLTQNMLDELIQKTNAINLQVQKLQNAQDNNATVSVIQNEKAKLEKMQNERITFFDTNEILKSFISNLIKVRYKNGFVDYRQRKHFFTDWGFGTPNVAKNIFDKSEYRNKKILGSDGKMHNIIIQIEKYTNAKSVKTKKIHLLDQNKNRVIKDGSFVMVDVPILKNGKEQFGELYLEGIKPQKRKFGALRFSRDNKLFNYQWFNKNLKDGDLIMVGTDIDGLDVTHDGILIFKQAPLLAHDVIGGDGHDYYDEKGKKITPDKLGIKNYKGRKIVLHDATGAEIMVRKPFYRNASFSATRHYGRVKDVDLVLYFVDRNWDTAHHKWYDQLNSQDLKDKGLTKANLRVPFISAYRVNDIDQIKYDV